MFWTKQGECVSKQDNKNHKTNQRFLGTNFYGCSFCCPWGKLGNPILGEFDFHWEDRKLHDEHV